MTQETTLTSAIPEIFRAEDLDWDDRVILTLQQIYRRQGFRRYHMKRFESYDMYVENKGFLKDSTVITFTGPNGKLMALRPDATLGIVKDAAQLGPCEKFFYVGNVFRVQAGSDEFSEISQVGVEYIGCQEGASKTDVDIEILQLALQSMGVIGSNCRLALSYMGLSEETKAQLQDQLRCAESLPRALQIMQTLPQDETLQEAISSLSAISQAFEALGCQDQLLFDLSLMGDADYYTGITFQGYVEGLPRAVLSGGRYDGLMERFGRNQGGIGFAVYLGEIASAFNKR